jgi:hypothetical protein
MTDKETWTRAEVAAIVEAARAEALEEHAAQQPAPAAEQPRNESGEFLRQLKASGNAGWSPAFKALGDDREELVELIRAEAAAGVAARNARGV